jgi:glyoxylase-like metal-dependent hydrolase (beta-lactamase superfamily II)
MTWLSGLGNVLRLGVRLWDEAEAESHRRDWTSRQAMTQCELPRQQTYGIQRRRVGEVVVTLINDGFEDWSFDILSENITAEEAKGLLAAAHLPPMPSMPVNVYVVEDGQRTILIDSGDGNALGAGGRLHDALAEANMDAAQIDAILLTHAHPDHVGGLVGPQGEALFPNAELVLHADELRFWRDDANFGSRPHLEGARRLALNTFAAYRSAMRTATGGEVVPGIMFEPLPGHTPGHSGYRITSAGESVLIWGDIAHWPAIQVPRPEVTLAFDIDPVQAAATRRRLLEQLAADGELVGGMHLNLPGFARIERDGATFALREDVGCRS